jgi:hypothetical protein
MQRRLIVVRYIIASADAPPGGTNRCQSHRVTFIYSSKAQIVVKVKCMICPVKSHQKTNRQAASGDTSGREGMHAGAAASAYRHSHQPAIRPTRAPGEPCRRGADGRQQATSLYTVRLRRHAVRSTIDSGEGIGRPKPNPLTHQGPVCSDPPPGQLPVVSN